MAEPNKPAMQVKQKSEKAFDRGVCFTFFADYWDTAQRIKSSLGTDEAFSYIEAVAEYALYDAEPELDPTLSFVWPTTKATIDKNIDRRKRGFGRENTEQTERIIKEYEKDPHASQKEIGKRAGASTGKVNKVIQQLKSDSANESKRADADHCAESNTSAVTDAISHSFSNASNERERERSRSYRSAGEEEGRTVYDLNLEELESLLDWYKAHVPYATMRKKFRIVDHGLSKDVLDTVPKLIEEKKDQKRRERINDAKDSVIGDSDLLNALSELSGYTETEWIDHLEEVELDAEKLWAAVNDGKFFRSFNKESYEGEFANDAESYWALVNKCFPYNFTKDGHGGWIRCDMPRF
jgi:hypothetical protein